MTETEDGGTNVDTTEEKEKEKEKEKGKGTGCLITRRPPLTETMTRVPPTPLT